MQRKFFQKLLFQTVSNRHQPEPLVSFKVSENGRQQQLTHHSQESFRHRSSHYNYILSPFYTVLLDIPEGGFILPQIEECIKCLS